jgi:hypothetical protein
MTYDKVELHLSAAPLSRAHAKRIKACGGTYSECRSPYATTRFVTVPAAERDLIDTLVRSYFNNSKRMTMIARGTVGIQPPWVTVQYVSDPVMSGKDAFEQFERGYAKAYAQAVRRGIIAEKGVDNA